MDARNIIVDSEGEVKFMNSFLLNNIPDNLHYWERENVSLIYSPEELEKLGG